MNENTFLDTRGTPTTVGDWVAYLSPMRVNHRINDAVEIIGGFIKWSNIVNIVTHPNTGFAGMGDRFVVHLDNGDVLEGDCENGFGFIVLKLQ